jgi:hypothetical protein
MLIFGESPLPPGVLAYVRHHPHRSRPFAYPLVAGQDPASAPYRHSTFQRWSLRGTPEGPGSRDSVSRSDRGHPCVVHPPSRLFDQEDEQSLRDFGGHTDCVLRGHSRTNALPVVLVSTVADSSRSGHNEEVLRASLRGTWGVCAGPGRQKEGPRGVQRAAMETRLFTKTIDQDLNRHRRSPFLAIVHQYMSVRSFPTARRTRSTVSACWFGRGYCPLRSHGLGH